MIDLAGPGWQGLPGALHIFTSAHLKAFDQVKWPPALPKGPYYQRRVKRLNRRWNANPRNFVPIYFTINGQIWCHPSVLAIIREQIDRINFRAGKRALGII